MSGMAALLGAAAGGSGADSDDDYADDFDVRRGVESRVRTCLRSDLPRAAQGRAVGVLALLYAWEASGRLSQAVLEGFRACACPTRWFCVL